ncbi:putative transporter C02C2.4 [Aphelenchoides besseyi]|nr:putative transporter C02C2.4 [Aphelenchoides besseyi]
MSTSQEGQSPVEPQVEIAQHSEDVRGNEFDDVFTVDEQREDTPTPPATAFEKLEFRVEVVEKPPRSPSISPISVIQQQVAEESPIKTTASISLPLKPEPQNEAAEKKRVQSPLWTWKSLRFRIAVLLAAALSIEGFMRSNINMAMVCMVNQTAVNLIEGAASPRFVHKAQCTESNSTVAIKEALLEGDVIMTKQEQATVLSAFYLGGLVAALPSGWFCDRYGPRDVVFYGALFNVIGTIVTPVTTRELGASVLTSIRFLMGVGQVVLVPCMNVLIARWFPLAEKSTAIAIATTGNQISVIVALFLTAELCQISWLGGWPSAFYVYAVFGAFLCVFWMVYVQDFPSRAKHIRAEEVRHIEENSIRGKINKNGGENAPWSRVFSSVVVWAIALSSFSQNFMNVGTIVYLPAYYSTVLGLKLTKNGIMSALPFIVQLITKAIFAGIADYLKHRKIMSHTAVAKLFNLIASLGAGICYILLTYCDCNSANMAIFLAVSAIGLSSGFIPGYNTSVVCIAPRYTSAVASFSRFLGQVASVLAPYMIGSIVHTGKREEWQIAFFIVAFVLISTGIFFQFCGSASVQDWARPPDAIMKPDTKLVDVEKPLTLTEGS